MKALSLLQPWAEAVLFLGKNIENRTWPTKHRGPLAIHCSKGWDKEGELWLRERYQELAMAHKNPNHLEVFMAAARLRRGCFAGLTEVVDCVPNSVELGLGKWAFGPYCWKLANTVPCQSFPGNGQLGLFEFDGGLFSIEGKILVQGGVKL